MKQYFQNWWEIGEYNLPIHTFLTTAQINLIKARQPQTQIILQI